MSGRQNGPGEQRVAVVMLHFRQPQWTAACLRSLRDLDHRDYSVFLVDNASGDGSAEELQREFPDIHLITQERPVSFARACNEGARQAAALGFGFFWFLNNDTRVFPDTLTWLLEAARGAGRAAVGATILHLDSPTQPLSRHAPLDEWGGGIIRHGMFVSPNRNPNQTPSYITGASLLVGSETFWQLGGFSEQFHFYFEDADFSFRLLRAGGRLVVARRALVLHKGGASTPSAENPFWSYHFARSQVVFCRRHLAPHTLVVYLLLVLMVQLRMNIRRPANVLAALRGFWDGLQGAPAARRFVGGS